jgi:biopolymer transport protein ExbD
MPRVDSSTPLKGGINVTPLVDVVLVLLIIFMIIAPRLQVDASVDLPVTERPGDEPDDGRRIVLTVDEAGAIRIDGEEIEAAGLPARLSAVAEERGVRRVLVKGDARLSFGYVRRTMNAVEEAGFTDVGLIARRRDDAG